LTEAEKRGIKSMAASQGLTLRQAILRAFAAWSAQLQTGAAPARGMGAGAEVQKPGQPSQAASPADARSPGNRRPSEKATPAGSGGRGAEAADFGHPAAPSPAWLRQATQLDWSKCPAAECLRGETGNVWVVRGTDAPLARVLQSVADGHPVAEIAEFFEITLLQLAAVLQFAAEGAAPGGSVKS
jgi:hypothetical protein